jgi:hypothetical protein
MPGLRLLWLRAQPWVPLFAVLACLPALANGIELDDVFHAAHAHEPGFWRTAFGFFSGAYVPAEDLPWWTDPRLELELLRPVAALTHGLDHALWPAAPWLMHLHSVLWYGLLVALVQRAYRAFELEPSRAALAALVFGLSQAHAMNVGWLAARNSVIAGVFVVATLILHHRVRARGSRVGAVVAPLLLGVALFANEGAVAAVGYLVAYAWVLDDGRRRWLSLVPYAVVVIAWRGAYEALGAGTAHSGIYLDPTDAPLAYVARTILHAVPMLAARLGLAVLDPLGSIPGATLAAFVAAVPFVAGLGWLAREHLRRDRTAQAFALGMVLACFTAGTTVPTDRGLLLLGLGGSVVVADLILVLRRASVSRPHRAVGWMLVALHLVVSPLLLPLRVRTTAWVHAQVERVVTGLPTGPEAAGDTVVLLNAPSDLLMLYSRAIVERRGETPARSMTWLYAGSGAVTITRTGPAAFELAATRPWLAAPLDRLLRRDVRFTPGQRFPTPCLTAEIAAVDESELPTAVRFALHDDRPGCRVVLLAWLDGAPRPFALPEPDAPQTLPPAVLF